MEAQVSGKSERRHPGCKIELKRLRSVALASIYGSLRKAADPRCVRRSALAHLAGTPLFERSPAGIWPTPAGQKRRASTILEEIDELIESPSRIARGHSGAPSVGVCTSVAGGNLRATLSQFVRRFRCIEITAIEHSPTDLDKALRTGTADIIILPSPASVSK